MKILDWLTDLFSQGEDRYLFGFSVFDFTNNVREYHCLIFGDDEEPLGVEVTRSFVFSGNKVKKFFSEKEVTTEELFNFFDITPDSEVELYNKNFFERVSNYLIDKGNIYPFEIIFFKKKFTIKEYLMNFKITLKEFQRIFKTIIEPYHVDTGCAYSDDAMYVYYSFYKMGITLRYEYDCTLRGFEKLRNFKIKRVQNMLYDVGKMKNLVKKEELL